MNPIHPYPTSLFPYFGYVTPFFRTSTDYGLTTYSLIVLITAIPVSYFIYHFLRKSFLIEEKLKDLILLAFRIRDKHYIDVAVKAKYAEQYDKAMVDTKNR